MKEERNYDVWLDEASFKDTGTYNVITNKWTKDAGWHYCLVKSFLTKEEAEAFVYSFNSFAPKKLNNWLIEKNKYSWGPTKPYIAFHPMHDGFYWEQFDTLDEATDFATKERYDDWCDKYL